MTLNTKHFTHTHTLPRCQHKHLASGTFIHPGVVPWSPRSEGPFVEGLNLSGPFSCKLKWCEKTQANIHVAYHFLSNSRESNWNKSQREHRAGESVWLFIVSCSVGSSKHRDSTKIHESSQRFVSTDVISAHIISHAWPEGPFTPKPLTQIKCTHRTVQ